MRPVIFLVLMCLFFLSGCYSMLLFNVGVVNKTAAANVAPLDPEVACAALAPFRFKVDSNIKLAPDVQTNWLKDCQKILTEQQQKKKP